MKQKSWYTPVYLSQVNVIVIFTGIKSHVLSHQEKEEMSLGSSVLKIRNKLPVLFLYYWNFYQQTLDLSTLQNFINSKTTTLSVNFKEVSKWYTIRIRWKELEKYWKREQKAIEC